MPRLHHRKSLILDLPHSFIRALSPLRALAALRAGSTVAAWWLPPPSIDRMSSASRLLLTCLGYRGASREHTQSDLRVYFDWCHDRQLAPLTAQRHDLELYLNAALVQMFEQPVVAKHLVKVAVVEADERHLCLLIHRSALPFAVADGLWIGTTLPPEAPPLPDRVTHLWLMPQLGGRVLLWAPSGWEQHPPHE